MHVVDYEGKKTMKLKRTKNKDKVKTSCRTIKIPRNRLALSILADNQLPPSNEPLVFAEDGWIKTNKGNKVKKWTTIRNGIRIWEPKLKDIPKLEALYWKNYQIQQQYHDEGEWRIVWDIIKETCPKGKELLLFIEKHPDNGWCYYNVHNDPHYGWSFSFDWLESNQRYDLSLANQKPVNIELGLRFQKAEKREGILNNRKLKCKAAFDMAMENKLRTMRPKNMSECGQLLKITINKRDYWYVADHYSGSLVMYWKPLYDFTNPPKTMTIDSTNI